MKIELKEVDGSFALILSDELLKRLNVLPGDWLHVTANADRSLVISSHDPTFERGLKIADEAMKTYRDAFTKLAK